MFWDDDFESNTYVSGLGTTLATNVKFTGQATIVPGWTAGYVLHIEADGSDALLGINQLEDNGPGVYAGSTNFVQTLQSFWFIKSESLGKLSVGLQSQASDNTAILVDGSGSLIPANFVQFDYGGFFLRDAAGNLTETTISGVMACTDCNGLTTNSVRYDTPTFAGFSASASWGEDDFWDVALRYAGEFAGFKLAAAAAYAEATDDPGEAFPLLSATGDSNHFQVGAYIQHVPTGLFVYGAYSDFEGEDAGIDGENYYVKAGIRQRWTPLGHTVLYGEYQDGNQDAGGDIGDGDVELWGLGVVQEIDNAAMSLWLSYRNIEASGVADVDTDPDVTTAGAGSLDFQYIKAGALINF
jgi:predicted porin